MDESANIKAVDYEQLKITAIRDSFQKKETTANKEIENLKQ